MTDNNKPSKLSRRAFAAVIAGLALTPAISAGKASRNKSGNRLTAAVAQYRRTFKAHAAAGIDTNDEVIIGAMIDAEQALVKLLRPIGTVVVDGLRYRAVYGNDCHGLGWRVVIKPSMAA